MAAKHIVVCDDDEFVYFTVQTYMSKMGYEVHEAHEAETGIRLIKEHKPQIVFMDIHMPGVDGYEACRRLRSDPETAGIPLVFVSAKDVSNGYSQEAEAGADYFVAKPFQPNDLAADLYFLEAAGFKPDHSTLSRLRVCHPLALEKAKKRPKVSPLELKKAAVEADEDRESPDSLPEIAGGAVSMAEFRKLRILVLSLSNKVDELEAALRRKGILGRDTPPSGPSIARGDSPEKPKT